MVDKKICTCCKQEKDNSEFYVKNKTTGSLRAICKQCHAKKRLTHYENNKEKYAIKAKQYNEKNKEKIAEKRKIYHQKIKDRQREYYREYNKLDYVKKQKAEYREKNRQKIRDSYKKHYKKNKEIINKKHMEYNKIKYKTDANYKLKSDLGRRMRKALKSNKELKNKRTLEYLGCDLDFLRGYLESKFTETMNWDEFFAGRIHIDHILPCASFDLTDPEQQKECFHYSNLQPLWWYDNLAKRDKLDYKVS